MSSSVDRARKQAGNGGSERALVMVRKPWSADWLGVEVERKASHLIRERAGSAELHGAGARLKH